ncbi:iron-containing alcohol dehydrogenase [Lachnospiraceae bacterium ZAX-1]
MLNFDLHTPTRMIYGKDEHKRIGKLLAPYAKKVLVHYGGASAKKSGLLDQVFDSLKAAGIEYVELGGVLPNPRVELAREGIKLAKKEKIDLVLAVGGGSAIDSAKAIAVGYYYDGDIWDLYQDSIPPKKVLPVATILTIPAAGSESSISTVLTNEETQRKLGYNFEVLRPLLSIVNPELFFTVPKNQIANGVADMMSHIFERYFTNTKNTDLTDGFCEAALKVIMKNALIVINDPTNYDAWFEIGFSGSFAHNNVLGVGREQDWACHGMEHELSAIYDVAHGAGLAVLTPAWMRYIYKEKMGIFLQFAQNVMGVTSGGRDHEYIINEGINRLSDFFVKMGLPQTLHELGIDEENIELMARRATGEEYNQRNLIGFFRKLDTPDVLAIYNSCK